MIRKSEQVNELLAALSRFQASVKAGARKGGTNPHFRSNYTRLEDAWAAAREQLGAHGLSVVQAPAGRLSSEGPGADLVAVDTMIGHESGQWLESTILVRVDDRQSGAQADGSAVTYACRYSFLACLGLPPSDDDGNAASAGPANDNSRPAARDTRDERDTRPEPRKQAPAGQYGDNTPDTPLWFGKHKGTPIKDLPVDYLEWLRDKGQKEDLRALAAAVLDGQETDPRAGGGDDEPPPIGDDDIPLAYSGELARRDKSARWVKW